MKNRRRWVIGGLTAISALVWSGFLMRSFYSSEFAEELRDRCRKDGYHFVLWNGSSLHAYPLAAEPMRDIVIPGVEKSGARLGGFDPFGRGMILVPGFGEVRYVRFDGQEGWIIPRGEFFRRAADVTLSPDGSSLLYVEFVRGPWRQPEYSGPAIRYHVVVLADAKTDRVIAESADPSSETVAWSADSREVVLSVDGDIRIYSIETSVFRAIGKGHFPSWSPDGCCLAWQTPEKRGVVFNHRTGVLEEVFSGEEVLHALRWSPDSRYLLSTISHGHIWGSTAFAICRIRDGAVAVVLKPYDGRHTDETGWAILR